MSKKINVIPTFLKAPTFPWHFDSTHVWAYGFPFHFSWMLQLFSKLKWIWNYEYEHCLFLHKKNHLYKCPEGDFFFFRFFWIRRNKGPESSLFLFLFLFLKFLGYYLLKSHLANTNDKLFSIVWDTEWNNTLISWFIYSLTTLYFCILNLENSKTFRFTVKVSQNIKLKKPSPCIFRRSIGFNYVILINFLSGPHICYV